MQRKRRLIAGLLRIPDDDYDSVAEVWHCCLTFMMWIVRCVAPSSIKSQISWTRFIVDRRFEPSSSHDALHQRETLISWRGSAEPRFWTVVIHPGRWLVWFDRDSDVTHTVYKRKLVLSDGLPPVANVFSRLSAMSFLALILIIAPSRHRNLRAGI